MTPASPPMILHAKLLVAQAFATRALGNISAMFTGK